MVEEVVKCRGRRVVFESRIEELPNGRRIRVDRVIFPDAVAVLPLFTDDCSVVLIKQYRPAPGEWLLEAPAGVLEEGENPEEAAARELEEEAGLKPRRLVRVASGYVSPGYSTEMLHFYLALDPARGAVSPEEHEVIVESMRVPVDEALDMVRRGEIRDAKTILLIQAAAMECSKGGGSGEA